MFNTPDIVEAPPGQDPRWQAIVARDRNFDGHFYYAVKTTSVYCRPSCAARAATKQRQLLRSCADAEQAGFRPCKRCKPNEPGFAERHAAKVAEICGTLRPHRKSQPQRDGRAGVSPLISTGSSIRHRRASIGAMLETG